MTIKHSKTAFLAAVAIGSILPMVVSANTTYTPMENIPGFESAGSDLATYILSIFKFGIWTIGISAMLMIVIGGFMYISSAGNTSSMGKAKGIITDAIIGVVLALSSYLILYVINPDLVQINLPTAQDAIKSEGDSLETLNDRSNSEDGSSGGSGGSKGSGSNSSSSDGSSQSGSDGNKTVDEAKKMKAAGCVYDQGKRNGCKGDPPYTDCSDFVNTANGKGGGGNTAEMYKRAETIKDPSSLKAGDVLVYPGHTVLCENNGCTKVIHAAGTAKGIVESNNGGYFIKQGAKVIKA